jgi:Xaa-Pro aminopeptidase
MSTRIEALRAELARRNLDAFVVPHADEFQNEYLPPHAERLAWLTGFTGSAGIAVVTADKAALFADGRYTLQAATQSPGWEQHHLTDDPPERWIEAHLKPGMALGFDPWLHTPKQVEALEKTGVTLLPVETNPIDAVWSDQPAPPLAPIVLHPEEYAGESSVVKRTRIAGTLRQSGIDATVLADPSAIAWLLNVRGGDVPCTPLPLSFAVLNADATVEWFVDAAKTANLGRLSDVRMHFFTDFGPFIATMGSKRVLADPAQCPHAVFRALEQAGATIERRRDPCLMPRAAKNEVELQGSRAAHRRDGAALARFLAWFDGADKSSLTEIGVAEKLEGFRAVSNMHRGPSFQTIAGAGPDGAIVHYHAQPESDRTLVQNSFLLLDSGAQYLDGTTDITRTLCVGSPSDEMKAMYTLVLKGHIAIATARFPAGTTGQQLDVLARQFLWQARANYDHGTGHGVGSYLSVHEGPQRISPKAEAVELKPGMILSNEPGFYKAGEYGIRIENLVAVREDGPGWLSFETLSLAPIDLSAVDARLLTPAEKAWLVDYHAKVQEALLPQLAHEDAEWLKRVTSLTL